MRFGQNVQFSTKVLDLDSWLKMSNQKVLYISVVCQFFCNLEMLKQPI